MVQRRTLWALLFMWCIVEIQVEGFLHIQYDYDVTGIYGQQAELTCKVETEINKVIKEVKWYKLMKDGRKSVVYYYEPPRWDTPGLNYYNRVELADDGSSLVIYSLNRNDESSYRCDVTVMANETVSSEIPQEMSVTMQLAVFVPPSDIKLSTLSSGNNLTLTCRSTRSKPSADITWIITNDGKSREVQSSKVVSEFTDNLADTIGYLYWTLGPHDQGTTFTCVVNHPDTDTTITKNVTLVPPKLQHPVPMYFDWLGTEVPYTTYTASQDITSNGAMTTVAPVKNSGLVKMILSPAQAVPINSTIVAIASAEGAFPKPTFTWWGEDLGTTNQPRLTRRLEKSQVFFCLVENPVGRVVMSVEFTAANTDDPATIGDKDTSVGGNIDDPVMASGAVVAAIAFGGLLLLFLFAVLIYYFGCKRPTDRQLSRRSVVQDGDDFDDYVEKQKPMYGQTVSPYEETSEMKHKTNDRIEEMVTSHEKDALLTTGNNYEDSPCSTKKQPYSDSSSTSTSGFSDDENGRNFHERRSSSANSSKERAITKHLNDFDENASFCDDYGSRFGLDDVGSSKPSLVEVEARESPFDGSMNKAESEDFSDTSSVGSGDTVEERRYPITHHPDESWEHLDPMGRVQTPV